MISIITASLSFGFIYEIVSGKIAGHLSYKSDSKYEKRASPQ